jgi:hypothetical protein
LETIEPGEFKNPSRTWKIPAKRKWPVIYIIGLKSFLESAGNSATALQRKRAEGFGAESKAERSKG